MRRPMNRRIRRLCMAVLAAAAGLSARAVEPKLGTSPRYCNPLPMVAGDGASASGDVTVIREEGRYYMYCTGGGAWVSDDLLDWEFHAVTGVPVAPDDLIRFAGAHKRLFTFNPDHVWERYGDMNEYTDVSWIEGPWMLKHNGRYYLQYSASGTQWRTYAGGYYTADHPTGPFHYAPNNPLTRRTDGLVTGTAHGSIVEAPDGNLWQFYTIVLNNPPGGRRVGMDPVAVDAAGNLSVRISDTPQWVPGVVANPARDGDSGSVAVSVNKMRAMNALSRFSSQQPGHDAAYAVDNSSGTWWEPSPDDASPTLTIDLGSATRFDVTQLFAIDSARLLFTGGRRSGRAESAAPTTAGSAPQTNAFQYTIDASTDGETFSMVLDERANAVPRNTIFNEFPPVTCRFVRLTLVNWPRATPLGIIEFTVFGRADGFLPAETPVLEPIEEAR